FNPPDERPALSNAFCSAPLHRSWLHMFRDLNHRTMRASAVPFVFLAFAGIGRAQESLLERDVLPILTKQCLGCHGGLRQKGWLDMRTIPLALKGGKSGPAVKAKDADASLMWQRVAADEMPPSDKKLPAAEKSLIKQWIED